ncbi:MAG: hypothetical protein K0B10_13570 [Vicingaceae bacterium]|nr:hypothetical protein [Vicingaceae bacterium]
MKYFFIFILIFSTLFSFSQQSEKDRQEITTIIDSIASLNEYHSSRVGYGGFESKQWKRFLRLKEIATIEELKELNFHINPIVRLYAFEALAEKDSNIFDLLLIHIQEKDRVTFFNSGTKWPIYISDLMILIVENSYLNNSTIKLNEIQLNKIDSVLLFTPNVLSARKNRNLIELPISDKYYDRIRQIVIEENNSRGLVALARFNKEEDVKLISDFLMNQKIDYYCLMSIREFPHKAFYSILESVWNKTIDTYEGDNFIRILCQAVAQYDNIELFNKAFEIKKRYYRKKMLKYVYLAITKYSDSHYVFYELKTKIKLNKYELKTILNEYDR